MNEFHIEKERYGKSNENDFKSQVRRFRQFTNQAFDYYPQMKKFIVIKNTFNNYILCANSFKEGTKINRSM